MKCGPRRCKSRQNVPTVYCQNATLTFFLKLLKFIALENWVVQIHSSGMLQCSSNLRSDKKSKSNFRQWMKDSWSPTGNSRFIIDSVCSFLVMLMFWLYHCDTRSKMMDFIKIWEDHLTRLRRPQILWTLFWLWNIRRFFVGQVQDILHPELKSRSGCQKLQKWCPPFR